MLRAAVRTVLPLRVRRAIRRVVPPRGFDTELDALIARHLASGAPLEWIERVMAQRIGIDEAELAAFVGEMEGFVEEAQAGLAKLPPGATMNVLRFGWLPERSG